MVEVKVVSISSSHNSAVFSPKPIKIQPFIAKSQVLSLVMKRLLFGTKFTVFVKRLTVSLQLLLCMLSH